MGERFGDGRNAAVSFDFKRVLITNKDITTTTVGKGSIAAIHPPLIDITATIQASNPLPIFGMKVTGGVWWSRTVEEGRRGMRTIVPYWV
ncbi:unnamed protein product [Calypogeia fissa]